MKDISSVREGLEAWASLAESSPDAAARFAAMRHLLCEELEAAGFSYDETLGTFSFPSGVDGVWRGVRCRFQGFGRTFESAQEGRDAISHYRGVAKAYLRAMEWLIVRGLAR